MCVEREWESDKKIGCCDSIWLFRENVCMFMLMGVEESESACLLMLVNKMYIFTCLCTVDDWADACMCVCVCVSVWLVTTLNKNAYVWLKIMYYNCWCTFFNEFVDACTHACVCKMRWWRGKRPFPTVFVQADWVKEWIQYCWWHLDTLCVYACDVNDLKKKTAFSF